MHTRIANIPCQVNATYYYPGSRGSYLEPPEPETWEWEVLDRKGYRAPWLEAKLTPADRDRIENELRAARYSEVAP
jgi:hypothetical protein